MAETTTRTEVIAAEPVESLAAMLEIEIPHDPGDVVPPLWHWTYLLDRRRQSELGRDGHPRAVGDVEPDGDDLVLVGVQGGEQRHEHAIGIDRVPLALERRVRKAADRA